MAYNPSPEKIATFTQLYIENGFNATKALVSMGLKRKSAEAAATVFKQRARLSLAERLRERGIDADSQAKKLAELREARMPKWNAGTEDWDIFDDGHLQLEVVKEINRIQDAYPAEKNIQIGDNITVIFDVDTKPEHPRERTLTVAANQTDAP